VGSPAKALVVNVGTKGQPRSPLREGGDAGTAGGVAGGEEVEVEGTVKFVGKLTGAFEIPAIILVISPGAAMPIITAFAKSFS
jgi:hypothetical protein